ncbi:MAG: hypothetical protein WAX04_09615 [Oscillospiraceae bacterium]
MNRFTKSKKDNSLLKDTVLPVLLFAVILFLFTLGLHSINSTTEQEQFNSTKQAITRAVVHCYAVEGAYPANLAYLEDQYGLTINYNKYLVDYKCFASNLMPDITVLKVNPTK